MDWSAGHYERIASEVLPAADLVVDVASPLPGEHVVDLGCGDGNAALLAATRGARVTGVDPAKRLLEVAAARAAERSLEATFLEGAADAMPLDSGVADAIVSVFGVIFAPDPEAAAKEIARVAAPTGRVVLSAWRPQGPIAIIARLRGEALSRARGAATAGPLPFAWHDEAALQALFGRHGFTVSVMDAALPIVGSSPAAFIDDQFRDHPVWLQAARVLDATAAETLRAEAVGVLAGANEDPGGFRVTSDYVVATLQRASARRRPGV
jgi:SAM-dependent methyltransferase